MASKCKVCSYRYILKKIGLKVMMSATFKWFRKKCLKKRNQISKMLTTKEMKETSLVSHFGPGLSFI